MRRSQIPLALAALGALLAGGVIVWALVAEEGDEEAPLVAAGPGEVFLEPAGEPGPDPFTPTVARDVTIRMPRLSVPSLLPPRRPASEPDRDRDREQPGTEEPGTEEPPTVAVAGVSAARPGLYGGTRDESSCDVEALISFLQGEPAKAAAFAAVQELGAEELPEWLRGLTPVLLQADTRVTNHGFRDGRATPRQSVLQAGTAVLVDELGIPRVKCGCGNPLLPPRPTPTAPVYVGPPWPEFDPAHTVTIVNVESTVIEVFVIRDVESGGYLERLPGSLPRDTPVDDDLLCELYPVVCEQVAAPDGRPGEPILATGALQVTLRWSSVADLDLAVTSPLGETVDYANRLVASGGRLDLDANSACYEATTTPVENIVWETIPPWGTYLIEISLYDLCGASETSVPYQLTVSIGEVDRFQIPLEGGGRGALSPASPTATYTVDLRE